MFERKLKDFIMGSFASLKMLDLSIYNGCRRGMVVMDSYKKSKGHTL
jgi:hypothetical protein